MCTLSCGVKTVCLLSCLLATAVVVSGGMLLNKSYEEREKYGEIGKFITKHLLGEQEWKILLSVTSVSVAAAALQLLTSLFLLLCATSKGGRISAKIWVGVNFFVILAVAACFICVMWQEKFRKSAEDDNLLLAFLVATAADVVFLFIFMFVNSAFSCRSS